MTFDKDAVDKTFSSETASVTAQEAAASQYLQRGERLLKRHFSPLCGEMLLDDALNAYARAMEESPESALLNSRLSKVFFLKGQYDRATKSARKAMDLSRVSDEPPAHQRQARSEAQAVLGRLQARQGHFQSAEKLLNAAKREGGLQTSRIHLALFQTYRDQLLDNPLQIKNLLTGVKAIASLISGLALLPFEPARADFAVTLQLLPRLMMAWLLEETRREEAALQKYLGIAADFPGLATVALVIRDMFREKGELAKARYWFESVIQRHPANLDAHFHLAQVLEEEEAYAEMAEIYHRMNELKPNNPHIHCNLANAYYYLQEHKEALSYYETALQVGKDPAWKAIVAQSIGNILYDYCDNPQAALAYYQMARSLDPTDVENYVQMGMIYFQNDDHVNAELIYRKALTIAPKNPKLYSNLGYLRWLEGDATGAIELYEKAISLDSGYEIPINNLGVIYLDMLGDVHKAIDHFRQAIDLDENYSLAYYNLGRAYSFLDNRLEAAHCFQMAQELNQFSRDLDSDELDARIQRLFDTCELELQD